MLEQVRAVFFDYVVTRFPSTAVISLFVALVGVSLVALSSRVSRNSERKPENDYLKYLHALQKEATGIGKRLSRASLSYRSMSALLATIEILGGAYFAMMGSTAFKGGAGKDYYVGGLSIASFLGCAIFVASAIQNRVHPYAKAVELRFRVWRIAHDVDLSELAEHDGNDARKVARALVEAIAQATKPFTDRPEDHRHTPPPSEGSSGS